MFKEKMSKSEAAVAEKEPAEDFDVCYKSKLLSKYFDSKDELVKAEAEYKEAHAKELQAKEERKLAAEKVDAAIKARDEKYVFVRSKKASAYKEYLSKVEAAKKEYLDVCDAEDKAYDDLASAADKALKEFCDKNPGGYHSTIKYDDGSTRTYSYNCMSNSLPSLPSLSELFDRFWF